MPDCDGSGICLRQIYINSYEKDTEIKCNYNCEPIKCPNYLVCESLNPKWLYKFVTKIYVLIVIFINLVNYLFLTK